MDDVVQDRPRAATASVPPRTRVHCLGPGQPRLPAARVRRHETASARGWRRSARSLAAYNRPVLAASPPVFPEHRDVLGESLSASQWGAACAPPCVLIDGSSLAQE